MIARIYSAGEKEYIAWLDRKDKIISLNKSLREELIQILDELGLETRFHFEG